MAEPGWVDVFAGSVSWYDADRGFGFVTCDGGDGTRNSEVFIHASDLAAGLVPSKGSRIMFELSPDPKGWRARRIEKLVMPA